MTILIFARLFPPDWGGIETYSYEIAKHLSNQGQNVIVLAPHSVNDKDFDSQNKFKTIRMVGAKNKWTKTFFIPLYFFYVLLRYKIDIVYATVWSPPGIFSYIAYKIFKKKYVVFSAGTEIKKYKEGTRLFNFMLSVFKNSCAIISVSNFTKELLIKYGIDEKLISVLPGGVDTNRFNIKNPSLELIKKHNLQGKKILLTVCRLIRRKGLDYSLYAFKKVVKKNPNIRYIIIGKGNDKIRLQNIVKRCKLENYVIFLENISNDELVDYYNLCDVFIMTPREVGNDFEGFGIVFVEANACGKPVIAGNSGGVPDAVKDGITGILVNPYNITEIKKAIIKLITDDDLAKQMGKSGRLEVERNFQWSKIGDDMLKILIVL